ncbi:hypothetical protein [Ferribacterium limneticum]|uniref:hypothetical protein n=1 Tax=Ferribacterium limneticum TaxID=76259 RepID=UPI001CFC2E6C|nr:hypothetical protein [Ferribacterium limneticum]UCV28157.1 hypothetical protein KI617_18240 [Ferribacterium limneticum]UCV32074.1 hypothetical protein KI608_18240 [Ferribacterium limneticum]
MTEKHKVKNNQYILSKSGAALVLFAIGVVLWLIFLYSATDIARQIDQKCTLLNEGERTLIDLRNTYANTSRICFHDSYADKGYLKDIYGIRGDAFENVKDGDVAIYAISESSIVGRIYLRGGFYIRKPISSACKPGADFFLGKSSAVCFIDIY